MSCDAIKVCLQRSERKEYAGISLNERSRAEPRELYSLDDDCAYFAERNFVLAQKYVNQVTKVASAMKSLGCDLEPKEVENAWWMFTLRGVVWDRSVYDQCGQNDAAVPSSMYYSRTPVWIT